MHKAISEAFVLAISEVVQGFRWDESMSLIGWWLVRANDYLLQVSGSFRRECGRTPLCQWMCQPTSSQWLQGWTALIALRQL